MKLHLRDRNADVAEALAREFKGVAAVVELSETPAPRTLAQAKGAHALGHPTLVNGIRSRPLSRWLERISTLLVAVPVALVLAVAGGAHRWSPAVSKALVVALGVWVVLALAWSLVEPRWRARILASTGGGSVQRRH